MINDGGFVVSPGFETFASINLEEVINFKSAITYSHGLKLCNLIS